MPTSAARLRTRHSLPIATVAAVDGQAITGAFVMMLVCDARTAGERPAKLALTQGRTSIADPLVALEIVAAELESGLRRQMMLSCEAIDPALALAWGVVDELRPSEALIERAIELAQVRAFGARRSRGWTRPSRCQEA